MLNQVSLHRGVLSLLKNWPYTLYAILSLSGYLTPESLFSASDFAGSQHERSHPLQGHVEEPGRHGRIMTRGTPWPLPPWQGHVEKPDRAKWFRSQVVLCLSIYLTTKICLFTVCYTTLFLYYQSLSLTTVLWKINLDPPVNSLLHTKGVFHLIPLFWLSSLCDKFIHTLATTDMIVYEFSTINSTESLEYF